MFAKEKTTSTELTQGSIESLRDEHIRRINTDKSCVCLAVAKPIEATEDDDEQSRLEKQRRIHEQQAAQEYMFKLYCLPSIAYVHVIVRDQKFDWVAIEVEDACYEIWSRIIAKIRAGKLHSYDRTKRFRSFYTTILRNEAINFLKEATTYQRKHVSLSASPGGDSQAEPVIIIEDPNDAKAREAFIEAERRDIVRSAYEWISSEDSDYGLILQFLGLFDSRDKVKPKSRNVVAYLSDEHNIEISEATARKKKQRATILFSHRISTEIGLRLDSLELELIEEDAARLGILPACKPALKIMREAGDVLLEKIRLP